VPGSVSLISAGFRTYIRRSTTRNQELTSEQAHAERRDGALVCLLGVASAAAAQVTAPPTPLRNGLETLIKASGAEVAVASPRSTAATPLMLNEDTVFTPPAR